MKDKILIGKKMTKKKVITNYLLFSFPAIIMLIGYKNVISPYLKLNVLMELLVMIMIYILVLVFLTPAGFSSESMEFSNEQVSYYYTEGYFQQLSEVFNIIKGEKVVPYIQMKTKDIQTVDISYKPYTTIASQKGYQLKMTFLMDDGSTLIFFPTSTGQMENKDYEAALQILEKNGVRIRDKFKLRKALSINASSFYAYVKKIEEGRD